MILSLFQSQIFLSPNTRLLFSIYGQLTLLYIISPMFSFVGACKSNISIDCIKSCPFQQNTYAIAYYQTIPTTQGAISVSKVQKQGDIQSITPLPSPPLLHLAWSKLLNSDSKYLLVAASRSDNILFYIYDPKESSLSLTKTLKISNDMFCLYVDIRILGNTYQLIVSGNHSKVIYSILDQQFNSLDRKQFSKHEHGVWTCRFNPVNASFACGDEVTSIYIYSGDQLIGKNSKAHKGGICDLTYAGENLLFSGGFDGIVCCFDMRKFNEPVYRKDWEGSIWRVIPDQRAENILICNYSETKFQIIDSTLSKQLWNTGQHHQSLAYAADWNKNTLLTASFYDQQLCHWKRNDQF